MSYDFSYDQLRGVTDIIDVRRSDFPTATYRFWHCLKPTDKLDYAAVEDFICAFMSQYNQKVRSGTF
jgi:hypothetical protein